ncbi:hypothetical protein J1N35_013987 [Gossypium stocksii]|uniref:Uncharacterized protein n=1 Tax=Gossypium stocksii TaxID=47602 RepID=A0A9D3VVQ1_9ROSI|nr:hypothetical protein J1N35_013987 [Gossypium stocksii]
MQLDHFDLQNHVTPFQEKAIGVHAKPWQNEMDVLGRDVQELHPNVQDIDWIFCSYNLLSLEVAYVNLPSEFKMPKVMFEENFPTPFKGMVSNLKVLEYAWPTRSSFKESICGAPNLAGTDEPKSETSHSHLCNSPYRSTKHTIKPTITPSNHA